MSARPANQAIVVGVDGSEQAEAAVRWAAADAARSRAPLHLIDAIGLPIDYAFSWRVPIDDTPLRREATEKLALGVRIATEAAAPDTITTEITDAPPIPVLLDHSESARMVVVGARGLGAIRRRLLGSVSSALARHAQCPVAIIPGLEEYCTGPVVVGVDGSPTSNAALAIAFDEASRRHADLVAVTTWYDPGYYTPRAEIEALAQDCSADSLAGYAEKYPDVTVRPTVAEADPADQLITESRDAQLIVVGSRGRGGFARMTLGSVSEAVLHRTEIPILIVRPSTPG
ncbi:universal stress protein [Nocardia goodfellowii]